MVQPAKHLNKTSHRDSYFTKAILQEVEYCQSVVHSISDDLGVRTVIEELMSASTHQKAASRCAAVLVLQAFCDQTRTDYAEYIPSLFRGLMRLLTDQDSRVVASSWDCLSAVTKVSTLY